MNQTVLRVYSATKSTLTTPEPDRYVMYNISTATRFMCVCLHDIFILLDFRSIQFNRWPQQAISGSRFKNYLLCQCCTCSAVLGYFLIEGFVLFAWRLCAELLASSPVDFVSFMFETTTTNVMSFLFMFHIHRPPPYVMSCQPSLTDMYITIMLSSSEWFLCIVSYLMIKCFSLVNLRR